jgi:hypothetical protein
LPSPFNGCGNLFLVMRAQIGFLSWFYFIKPGNILAKQFCVFIINLVDVFLAKIAHFVLVGG